MNRRAFTFVEAVLVAVLLGVVAIISAPFFYDFDRATREKKTRDGLARIHAQLALWQSNARLGAAKALPPPPRDAWTKEENWTLGARPLNELVHLGGIKILDSQYQGVVSCADLQAVYLEGGYGWVFEPPKGQKDLTQGKVYAVTDDCSKSNPLSWSSGPAPGVIK